MRSLAPNTRAARKCFEYIEMLPHFDLMNFEFPESVGMLVTWLYASVSYLPSRISAADLLQWVEAYKP